MCWIHSEWSTQFSLHSLEYATCWWKICSRFLEQKRSDKIPKTWIEKYCRMLLRGKLCYLVEIEGKVICNPTQSTKRKANMEYIQIQFQLLTKILFVIGSLWMTNRSAAALPRPSNLLWWQLQSTFLLLVLQGTLSGIVSHDDKGLENQLLSNVCMNWSRKNVQLLDFTLESFERTLSGKDSKFQHFNLGKHQYWHMWNHKTQSLKNVLENIM